MTHYELPPKPELDDYLNQDKLKDICMAGNHEMIYKDMSRSIAKYEKDLKQNYADKDLYRNPNISEEDKKKYHDIRSLGL
jgi:hypothetical protein